MASWQLRVCGACALVAPWLLLVPVASCGTEVEDEAGKAGQPCFPGDTCNPGLTCVATAIEADGANMGTDGGQCFCLGPECEPKVAAAAADAEVEAK
jgi:hypothetical protein